MALDNAEFIAELSILDPPGTDPLNQGDDHIRTTKKAVQQSFPNVASAVPQTGAQMAQMAIKNEPNTFTQLNIFDANIRVSPGTIAAPGYHFNTDTATGFSRAAGSILHVSAGGANPFSFHPTQMIGTVPIYLHNGTPLLPSYSFASQADTGMYRDTSSRISFASAGVFKMLIDFTQVQAVVPFIGVQGSAAAPSFSFAGRTQTGLYSLSDTAMAIAVQGSTRMIISTTDQTFSGPLSAPLGTQASPAYHFTGAADVGLYATTTAITAVANNTQIWAMSTNGNFSGLTYQNHVDGDLGATVPGWTFNNDADTGIGRAGVNGLNIIAGGLVVANFDGASAQWMGSGFSIRGDDTSTAARPAFAYTNDTDTGMFRLGTNQLAFATAGVERFRLNADGRAIFNTPNTLELNTPAATTAASVQLRPGGSLYWELASGTNSSRLFSFVRYNDSGGFLGLPLQIDRDTGGIIMPELPTSNPGGSGRLWKSGGFIAIT